MWLGCASRTAPSPEFSPEEELARQPVFLPYEVPPTHGPGELDAALKRHFPPVAKACNAPPFVVWTFVNAEGKVLNAQISRTSGDEEVDRAGLAAIREVHFTPARNRGKAVPVWIAVTLEFSPLCEVIRS
ncbi:MAG: energy transducer TonB [Gemmatimonadetes bacterium]|nr:energy transducer TonB [Gemmatimonadota bacterium]